MQEPHGRFHEGMATCSESFGILLSICPRLSKIASLRQQFCLASNESRSKSSAPISDTHASQGRGSNNGDSGGRLGARKSDVHDLQKGK
jgi:hypothetical protein